MKFKAVVYSCLIAFVASLESVAHAQTFSVIHTFTGVPDGKQPIAGVTIRGGSLFGPSLGGGDQNHPVYGTVYQMSRLATVNNPRRAW